MSEAPITGGPFDAHTPPQMAALLRDYGVKKARLAPVAMMTLGLLGGAYIALGGMFYTLVMTESGLGFGPSRLLGGLAFRWVWFWWSWAGPNCSPATPC